MVRNLSMWVSKLLGNFSVPGGFRLWCTFASIGFVAYSILRNGEEILELSLGKFSQLILVFGFILCLLSLLINAFAWKKIVGWLGHEPTKFPLISLFLRSNLLKYLPGGFWHFVERLRSLRFVMNKGQALASVLMEPLFMVAGALLLVPLGGWQSGLAVLWLLPVLILMPRWREPLLIKLQGLKLGQLKKADSTIHHEVDFGQLNILRVKYPWFILLVEAAFVFCRFCGFFCCLIAFNIHLDLTFSKWVSSFALAWVVGLIVPGAPGGLGVFEAAFLVRVGALVAKPPLLGALLCYRLVSTISDIFAAIFSYKNGKLIRNRE